MIYSIKIAKDFSMVDWNELRPTLLYSKGNWPLAIQVFEDRMNSRFINPIEKIKSIDKKEGEGFSIALISVVLIEFLAAFEFGKIYKVHKEGLAPHEYYSGIALLKSFFRSVDLFSKHFESNNKVQRFYENIRCGLVHEARTMGNDVIISNESNKNTSPHLMYFKENEEWRLNRDLMLETIKAFGANYKERLLIDEFSLRKKFILKMDDIAGLNHVWYFIYGSNLYEEQLKNRLITLHEDYLQKEKCSLQGYDFTYNKRSKDGSSKGNILKMENGIVEGIAILILDYKLDEFIKRWESGYVKTEVQIQTDIDIKKKNSFIFKAYTCISDDLTSAPPTNEYVLKIIKGAYEHNLTQEYIDNRLSYTKQ